MKYQDVKPILNALELKKNISVNPCDAQTELHTWSTPEFNSFTCAVPQGNPGVWMDAALPGMGLGATEPVALHPATRSS